MPVAGLLAMKKRTTDPMLRLLETIPAFRNLESGIRNLNRETEIISRQLGAWVRNHAPMIGLQAQAKR